MRAVVLESFVGFTRDLEGPTNFLYLDVLGFVTTGYGNLVDPIGAALSLPWRRPDGSLATRDEVIAAWSTVKALKGQRDPQGRLWTARGGFVFSQFTTLRLDAGGVDRLVRGTVRNNDEALQTRYADYPDWPACAQMAVHSLAWACGAAYVFPKMDAALRERDFDTAAREIEMTPASNPGNNLKARNRANELLMLNAARVQAYHLDPETLNWTSLIGVSDAETLPDLSTLGDDDETPREPVNAATHATIHPDPSAYLRPVEWLNDDDYTPPDDAA